MKQYSSLHDARVQFASKIAIEALKTSASQWMWCKPIDAVDRGKRIVERCLFPFYESNDIEDVAVEYDAMHNSLAVRIVPKGSVQFKFEIERKLEDDNSRPY